MAHTLGKVLIANRGEIACRIIRTLRALGKETVAVYSEADADALHVQLADEACLIGPPPAAESYLRADAIIEAAHRCRAQAIHPGYGFLSENAGFARAVEEAGLVFIGPQPEAIEAMGSKSRAKDLMKARGVPVIPGYNGEDQSDEALIKAGEALGVPLLVKASAGGGGKGMRVVEDLATLKEAIHSARREAKSSFGDDRLLLERYVSAPRHIEVQIFGDGRGEVIHLFERECSIQRRHQKIIEESPSPALDDALRQQICQAAVLAGQALNYRNAGTVEFILDGSGAFYFLEVNTRLQVEHPVTEVVTGLDLVALQVAIAEGEGVGSEALKSVQQRGHGIECRIYAEDPAEGFLPATGRFGEVYFPSAPWLRVDGGVGPGGEASIHYDPMVAKVITQGETRAQALDRMGWALARIHLPGVVTNCAFLRDVISNEAFRAGQFTTHFIPDTYPGGRWSPPALSPEVRLDAMIAAVLYEQSLRQRAGRLLPGLISGWRNNAAYYQKVEVALGGEVTALFYRDLGEGRFRIVDGAAFALAEVIELSAGSERSAGMLRLVINGHQRRWRVVMEGAHLALSCPGLALELELLSPFGAAGGGEEDQGSGVVVASMPGKVLEVRVAVGDEVQAGQELVILEAMKMEHTLRARVSGRVVGVRASPGETVSGGDVLVEVEESVEESD